METLECTHCNQKVSNENIGTIYKENGKLTVLCNACSREWAASQNITPGKEKNTTDKKIPD